MIYRYLQAAVPFLLCLRAPRWDMHKDPSDMSLHCSQLFCKINTLLALLFDQNNISEEKYYFNNNSYINFSYVFHFSSLVSVFRNTGWFGTAGSQDYHTTPHCILDTQTCCFFVLSGTHITPNSLPFKCLLCFAACLLGLLMEKTCH
jgi:hypothetical protein